jgi:predicted TIM-barrel fold metal-dependent hydrolase
MLRDEKCWVKLSGAYVDSRTGPPKYEDSSLVARAYIQAAPHRLLWGTDWPHPSIKIKPDDALLFDLLAAWVPDRVTLTRILVDNPAKLFGFR